MKNTCLSYGVPSRAPRIVANGRMKALAHAPHAEFDAPFVLYVGATGELSGARAAAESRTSPPREAPAEVLAIAAHGRAQTRRRSSDRYRLVLPIREVDDPVLVAITHLPDFARSVKDSRLVKARLAGLIHTLTAAIDAKDPYTCGHSERVARIALEVGREVGLSQSELDDIYLAGLLHDVGKIGIPGSILSKREPLTAEELMKIRQHVPIGCRILEGSREISHLLPLVLSHHERYDGMGYPRGLSGEAIPLLARILAVADCYDAMNTCRPYRTALARGRIEEVLEEERNRQWDGKVIDAFFRARERIYSVQHLGVGVSARLAVNIWEARLSPA